MEFIQQLSDYQLLNNVTSPCKLNSGRRGMPNRENVSNVLNFNTSVHSAYREPHNFKNVIVRRQCAYVLRKTIGIKQRIFP